MEKLFRYFINYRAAILLEKFVEKEKIGEYRKFLGLFEIRERCKINKYLKFFCFRTPKYIQNTDKVAASNFLRNHHELSPSQEAYEKSMSLYLRLGDKTGTEKIRNAFENPELIYEAVKKDDEESKKVKNLVFLSAQISPEKNVYQEYIAALQAEVNNSFSNMKSLALAEKENAILAHLETQKLYKTFEEDLKALKIILNLMLIFPDYIYRMETVYMVYAYGEYGKKQQRKKNGF